MRTLTEIRVDLDAVNDAIETKMQEIRDLNGRRRELEVEYADTNLGPARATAQAMDRIMRQSFPSLFGGKS